MCVTDEKNKEKFESELIQFFEENTTFDNPLETGREALSYLIKVMLYNIRNEKVSCNEISTSIMAGIIEVAALLSRDENTDDLEERVHDYIREMTKSFAHLGQRYEIDILSKKRNPTS